MKNLIIVGFFAFCLALNIGCDRYRVVMSGETDPGTHRSGNYDHRGPDYEGNDRKGGPPPWAPAHGYRAKHQYRYYPESRVYYDTGRGVYFYYHNGDWQVSASLPGSVRIDIDKYVTLEMDSDRPYEYHHKVEERYPPERSKGKRKTKDKWKK